MTDYPYDPDLPYVVVSTTGQVIARFLWLSGAEEFSDRARRVIDTTPKPRVPADAQIVTWLSAGFRRYAERINSVAWMGYDMVEGRLEDLPGVTPDTVFTVLEERRS